MYWYVSIYSEKCFWPQYMYPNLSPNNGFCWCPLGKLSNLGLEQLSGEYHRSRVTVEHNDGKQVQVGNTMPIEVQTYDNIEVRRAHVCWNVCVNQIVHESSSSYETFCRLISQAICTYLVIVV